MIYSLAEHAAPLGRATTWLDEGPTLSEMFRLYRTLDIDGVLGGLRRSAKLDNYLKVVVPRIAEGKIHKVEDIGDDAYTIFRKEKGKSVTYTLYRNAEMLIGWKPSPRDAETRIHIERMRHKKAQTGELVAVNFSTKRLKQIPEWGTF